ncbi:MAG: aldehyde dehydrogenase [Aestuariivita sp.]|uniref:aldehyde dehydrogenase n=1 Tax=Aestuariivita sp. TaxID=1872407 RepID=UPI003BB17670
MKTYRDIAAALALPRGALIDGDWLEPGADTFASLDPFTGAEIARLPACGLPEVDRAVAAARRSFEAGVWSGLHPAERKGILCRLADLILHHAEELAVLEALDAGKPVADCLGIDVPETAKAIRWHAEAQDKLYDQIAPSAPNAVGLIVREPVGVVAAVLPWNFPLMMLAWKLGPALATGNSLVVKPAENTSLSTLRVAELALEAGVPPGVFSVVTGLGGVTGEALARHMDVDAITFTGSTAVGRRILEAAAQTNLKEVCLEMGGKSAAVVLSDADQIERIAAIQANAIFWNMGENCTANSRIIVHKDRHDDLVAALAAQTADWALGDQLDEGTRLGPLVSDTHFKKVTGLVDRGKAQGARVVTGGQGAGGLLFQPTIFADVSAEMDIFQQEIFGPVVSVTKADSDEEAVALANQSDYGLAATLYTRDIGKAHRYARKLRAGTVGVNAYSEGEISTPFGGFKASGFGGRDNGIHAHDQYTELKTIWIDLDG